METLARRFNRGVDLGSRAQLCKEMGGSPIVSLASTGDVRRIENGKGQRYAMRVIQGRRRDGVLMRNQSARRPSRAPRLLTCRILMEGSISMNSATEIGKAGNSSSKASTLTRLSEISSLYTVVFVYRSKA